MLRHFFFLSAILLAPITSITFAQPISPTTSPYLTSIAEKAFRSAQAEFSKLNLKDDEFAVTVIDLRDPDNLTVGSFRGDAGFYPASVVKLFYLAAAEQWLEEGKLTNSPELERALSDMIVTSNNAACQFVLDCLTVPNGLELSPPEMEKWIAKRNAVNRYFASMGYEHINTNQKTYVDNFYGLDKIYNAQSKNQLTSYAAARLMTEIALHKIVTPARCDHMLSLLHRDPTTKPTNNPDDQNLSFTAKSLSPGDQLWSKAGWTSTSRHDVAFIQTHDGLKFVLATFTTNHGTQRQILPAIAKSVIESLHSPPN